jgi:hypothetical protein
MPATTYSEMMEEMSRISLPNCDDTSRGDPKNPKAGEIRKAGSRELGRIDQVVDRQIGNDTVLAS